VDNLSSLITFSSNHVMDDLLPYMCPISDCASGHMMFVRRQHLEVHLRTRHPLESFQQCPFCDKNIELDSTKHMGHHMEEIAFGVLTTAYEEWSYDDTNSEASIPVVHTKSPPRRTFFCTGYPPCQRSFFNIEILARHIRYVRIKIARTTLVDSILARIQAKDRLNVTIAMYVLHARGIYGPIFELSTEVMHRRLA